MPTAHKGQLRNHGTLIERALVERTLIERGEVERGASARRLTAVGT